MVRSALSNVQQIDNFTFGNHPLVTRHMHEVFVNTPALPCYKQIWDVSVVLKYLRSMGDNTQLSPQDVTMKTTMGFVMGQPCQTIEVLNVQQMVQNDSMWSFHINKLLKTSRPGKHFGMIEIKTFTEDKVICPVTSQRVCGKDATFKKELLSTTSELLEATQLSFIRNYWQVDYKDFRLLAQA